MTEQAPDPQSYEFLTCREVGHAWDPGGFDDRKGTFGIARILSCLRCPTQRHDIYGARGALISRQYKYPEGYQMPKGESLSRDEWRAESLRRAGFKTTLSSVKNKKAS